MSIRKSEIITGLIMITSFILVAIFYPQLPDKIASHWNIQGQVDGYMTKSWGIFFPPTISAVLWILFLIIPRIDPKKENIQKFRKYFNGFIILLFLFLLFIYLLTIFWNLGYHFNIIRFLTPAIGILFYYAGILVSNAQPNWSVGIRTPWTLSNETVWQKTHHLGGILFRICGVLSFVAIFWTKIAFFMVLGSAIVSALICIIYSYWLYKEILILKS